MKYTVKDMYLDMKNDIRRYSRFKGLESCCSYFKIPALLISCPSLLPILNHRFGFRINANPPENFIDRLLNALMKAVYFFFKYLSVLLVKIDIDIVSEIGGGLLLSDTGNIIIGVKKMGNNCTIHNNVTLGMDFKGEIPRIGDNIWIGPDSVIYGGIKLEDNIVIGAGSVISKSLVNNIYITGNPGKIIKKNIKHGPYRFYLNANSEI